MNIVQLESTEPSAEKNPEGLENSEQARKIRHNLEKADIYFSQYGERDFSRFLQYFERYKNTFRELERAASQVQQGGDVEAIYRITRYFRHRAEEIRREVDEKLKARHTSLEREMEEIEQAGDEKKLEALDKFGEFQENHTSEETDQAYGFLIREAMDKFLREKAKDAAAALSGNKGEWRRLKIRNRAGQQKCVRQALEDIRTMLRHSVQNKAASYFDQALAETKVLQGLKRTAQGNPEADARISNLIEEINESLAIGKRAEQLLARERKQKREVARYLHGLDLPIRELDEYRNRMINPIRKEYLGPIYGELYNLTHRFDPTRMERYKMALDQFDDYLAAMESRLLNGIRQETAIKERLDRLMIRQSTLLKKLYEFDREIPAGETVKFRKEVITPIAREFRGNIDAIIKDIRKKYVPERHEEYEGALNDFERFLDRIDREVVRGYIAEKLPEIKSETEAREKSGRLLQEARQEGARIAEAKISSGDVDFQPGQEYAFEVGGMEIELKVLDVQQDSDSLGVKVVTYEFRVLKFGGEDIEDIEAAKFTVPIAEKPEDFRDFVVSKMNETMTRIEAVPLARNNDRVKQLAKDIMRISVNLQLEGKGDRIRQYAEDLNPKVDELREYLDFLEKFEEVKKGLGKSDQEASQFIESVNKTVNRVMAGDLARENPEWRVITDYIIQLEMDYIGSVGKMRERTKEKIRVHHKLLEILEKADKNKLAAAAKEWYARFTGFLDTYKDEITEEQRSQARQEAGLEPSDQERLAEMVGDDMKKKNKGGYSQSLSRFVTMFVRLEELVSERLEEMCEQRPEEEPVGPKAEEPPSPAPSLDVPEPETAAAFLEKLDREMRKAEQVFKDNRGFQYFLKAVRILSWNYIFAGGEKAKAIKNDLTEIKDLFETLNHGDLSQVKQMVKQWNDINRDILEQAARYGSTLDMELESAREAGFDGEARRNFHEIRKGNAKGEALDTYKDALIKYVARTYELENMVNQKIIGMERATEEKGLEEVPEGTPGGVPAEIGWEEDVETERATPDEEAEITQLDLEAYSDFEPHEFASTQEMLDYFNIKAEKGDRVRAIGPTGQKWGDVFYWGKDGSDFIFTGSKNDVDLSREELMRTEEYIKADHNWDLRPYLELSDEELDREMEEVSASFDGDDEEGEEPEELELDKEDPDEELVVEAKEAPEEEMGDIEADQALENGTLVQFTSDEGNWEYLKNKLLPEAMDMPGAKITGVRRDPDGSVWLEIDAEGFRFSEAASDIDDQIYEAKRKTNA